MSFREQDRSQNRQTAAQTDPSTDRPQTQEVRSHPELHQLHWDFTEIYCQPLRSRHLHSEHLKLKDLKNSLKSISHLSFDEQKQYKEWQSEKARSHGSWFQKIFLPSSPTLQKIRSFIFLKVRKDWAISYYCSSCFCNKNGETLVCIVLYIYNSVYRNFS